MELANLKEIFNRNYQPSSWKEILLSLFPGANLYLQTEDVEITDTKHQIAKRVTVIGDLTLNDQARIQFFEVELQDDRKVTRNRVGLRNLIHPNVIPGDVDGILATYYCESARDWRVTFISKSMYWDEEHNEIKTETHPKRYTYVLGDTETHKTALERFMQLLESAPSGIKLHDILKAFSVEKISKQFFIDYKYHFEKFSEYLTEHQKFNSKFTGDSNEEVEKNIRNFVKRLLGRIIFLYFVQKKGWLGVEPDEEWGSGKRDFIQDIFKKFEEKSKFYSKCLVNLFYNTLNTKRDNDIIEFDCIAPCKIPYLNGGLFDQSENDPIDVDFKQEMFEALFHFFDQYNFTIDESIPDDIDIGIDPEMLGMIFENLLEENRNKGTYYTPKEVVHYMCKESLALYISQELGDRLNKTEKYKLSEYVRNNLEDIPGVVLRHASDIYNLLEKVKICDPAIGSGAFQLGMVFEILRIKRELFGFTGKSHFDYKEEKLNVFKNSIYGVDLDPGAVDIARLRFWLSLVVDEDVPSTLPNLDYKIIQGDSLKENFEDIDLSRVIEGKAFATTIIEEKPDLFNNAVQDTQTETHFSEQNDIKTLIDAYFIEDAREKKEDIHKHIDGIVLDNIEYNLEEHKHELEGNKLTWQNSINKKVINLSKEDQIEKLKTNSKEAKEIAKLEKEISKVDDKFKKLKLLQLKPERPYFLWHLFFNDIFETKGGFDILIGNPPYGVKVEDAVRKEYSLISKDSYGVFMAMAIQKLIKKGGILCFIVSDTWLTIKSHKELREQVLKCQVKKVIRLNQDCFNATVNSSIFTLINTASNENNIIAADLTNLSTRKDVPVFRERLYKLDDLKGEVNATYAVYEYSQDLISTNSNYPIFVGSPKFIKLLNDNNCETESFSIVKGGNKCDIDLINVEFNQRKYKICLLDNLSEIVGGVKTYDNSRFIKSKENLGRYKTIKSELIVNEELSDKEKAEGIIIESDSTKYYVEFDKSGTMVSETGLINYYKPPEFYLDWSETAVSFYKDHNGLRNKHRYFELGITFSVTGIYAPTFRLGCGWVFGQKGATLFSYTHDIRYLLAILCSKFSRYLLKNYISHSVDVTDTQIGKLIIFFDENNILIEKVKDIVNKLMQTPNYDINSQQKEIDKIIYELYGLNEEDINEVETWFARRYPKLAKYAYIKTTEELPQIQKEVAGFNLINSLINKGESKTVEFKSSLRYCYRQNSPQNYIEHEVMKTIAGFLNSEGGTLLIGVDDEGNKLGLQNDFDSFKGHDKKDEFQKHFDNLLSKYFDNTIHSLINLAFNEIDNKIICLINIPNRASNEVWLTNKSKNKEEFYIRRFASTIELTPREAVKYIMQVWG